MRQTLYHVIGTSCNCFAPCSTKQPAGKQLSRPQIHAYLHPNRILNYDFHNLINYTAFTTSDVCHRLDSLSCLALCTIFVLPKLWKTNLETPQRQICVFSRHGVTFGAAGRWMLHHVFSSARHFLHYAHQDPCGTPNEIIPSVFLRACKNSKPAKRNFM